MSESIALLADPAAWVALATLIAMEVVLGIDNLIFISILTNKLPESQRARARQLGIGGALVLRLALLGTVAIIVTAVGMTPHVPIMVVPVVVAVAVMLLAATPLANFIQANPTVVMLALGFLLLIGATLIAEGFGAHVSKGYIYAAMAFSALVEDLNIMSRRSRKKQQGTNDAH